MYNNQVLQWEFLFLVFIIIDMVLTKVYLYISQIIKF